MKSGRRAQKRETDDGQAVPRGNKPLVDGSYSNVFANPSSVLLLQFESVRTKMSVRECLSFGGVYMSPARCASVCLGNRALSDLLTVIRRYEGVQASDRTFVPLGSEICEPNRPGEECETGLRAARFARVPMDFHGAILLDFDAPSGKPFSREATS